MTFVKPYIGLRSWQAETECRARCLYSLSRTRGVPRQSARERSVRRGAACRSAACRVPQCRSAAAARAESQRPLQRRGVETTPACDFGWASFREPARRPSPPFAMTYGGLSATRTCVHRYLLSHARTGSDRTRSRMPHRAYKWNNKLARGLSPNGREKCKRLTFANRPQTHTLSPSLTNSRARRGASGEFARHDF